MKYLKYIIIILLSALIGGVIGFKLKETRNKCLKEKTIENIELYYLNEENAIYTVNDVQNIYLGKQELRNYENVFNSLEELIERDFTLKKEYEDKTVLYELTNNKTYQDKDINILKCTNGNYYIGNTDLKYTSSFCKDNKTKKFIRTYQVLNLEPSIDGAYYYLTLRAFQSDEVYTIKVRKTLNENITENKNYEFTFIYDIETKDKINTESISSIFNNTTVLKIEETDKIELEQTQETID